MKRKFPILLTATVLLFVFATAQTNSANEYPTYYGKAGIIKKVSELPPPAAIKPPAPNDPKALRPLMSPFKDYRNLGLHKGMGADFPIEQRGEAFGKMAKKTAPAAIQRSSLMQQVYSNFLSLDFYEYPRWFPPDPSGAVSSSQIVVSTNSGISVFEKPGANDAPILTPTGYSNQLAPASLFVVLDDFFSPVLPAGSNTSDPHVRYDRLTKRWFIVCIEVNPTLENNNILLAVSNGDRITNTSSFTYYAFNSSLFPYNPNAPYAPFLDYPTLGIDENSVVIGGNQYGYDSLTNVGYVIDKSKLLNGKLQVKPFELGVINNSTAGGIVTPQGVHNDDPNCKYSFFVGTSYYDDAIIVATIRYDLLKRPHLQGEDVLSVQPYFPGRPNSSPGGLQYIDQLDARLYAAEIHKNKLTGKSSLWTAHVVGVDQSGNFTGTYYDSSYVQNARSAARWYEVGNVYSNPAISQSGTVLDASEPSGRRAVQYFNASIAASGQGHAVIGGTTDAWNQYINVFVTDRYNNDPDGAMSEPVKATNTTAMYAPYYGIGRWGDFSQTVVDPEDDQTIWTFQEYTAVDDDYGVRVVQVKAPAPAVPLPFGPLSNASDTMITLQGAAVDNRGFFDPGKELLGPGYNRLLVKATGGIAVSNIKFISPTKISFKLHTKGTTAGSYTLKVINPDGQSVTTHFIVNANSLVNSNTQLSAANTKMGTAITMSTIAPNPTANNATLQLTAASDFSGRILLLDMNGKVIQEKAAQFIKGNNNAIISLASLGSGAYIVVVYDGNNLPAAVQKVVKQ